MKKVRKKLLALVTAAMMLNMVGCGNSSEVNKDEGYKAGTYEVEGNGMKGAIKLAVTFSDTKITEIEIGEHAETPGISDAAFDNVPKDIIEYQSLGVDIVTGATMTSNAIIDAVTKAVEKAGGNVEYLKSVEVDKSKTASEKITKEADVIVVGGGGAGLATAVSAAEEGASVIVIEVNPYLGGNTIRSAGAMSVCDSETTGKNKMNQSQIDEVYSLVEKETEEPKVKEWQEIVKSEIDEHLASGNEGVYDSLAFNSLQLYFRFGKSGNPELLEKITSEGLQAKEWLAELGLPWAEESHVVVGDNWPRWVSSSEHKSGIAYVETFENAIEEQNLNVEVITQVRGEELIVDEEGNITGVKAIANDGTPYELNANNGVVLATGGFAANKEMMTEYSDGRWESFDNIMTTNDPSSIGDGIVMAKKAGASLVDMGHVQVLPIADPETGYTDTLVGASTNLYVNNKGERFVDESSDRDTLTNAILAQPDSELFIISSSENAGIDVNRQNIFGRNVEELIEQGKVFKADTLEELAKIIGVDEATFVDNVNTFNEAVKNGVDSVFGRTTFGGDLGNLEGTPEIKTGPYYACKRKPASHITKGGISINLDGYVVNEKNETVKGLYAAGEVVGGSSLGGIVQAITDGYRVGKLITSK